MSLLWRPNNFFFSTHCLMYKKSSSFVYKFVVNCQVFLITPSVCTLHTQLKILMPYHMNNTFGNTAFLDIYRCVFNWQNLSINTALLQFQLFYQNLNLNCKLVFFLFCFFFKMANIVVCHNFIGLNINFNNQRGFQSDKICRKYKFQGT